jgi:hypothetical protein
VNAEMHRSVLQSFGGVASIFAPWCSPCDDRRPLVWFAVGVHRRVDWWPPGGLSTLAMNGIGRAG